VSSRCVEFLRELGVEMRPWQASVLTCVVLARTTRDLRVQEFLRVFVVGVATLIDLTGLIIVEILHSAKGGDLEQVCSNLETNLSFLRLLISLSLSHLCLYFACFYCLYLLYA